MKEVNPINYKIRLEPDLENFRFSGNTEILLGPVSPVDKITLNILDLEVWGCKASLGSEFVGCPFHINLTKEEITTFLPKETATEITLRIDYMGHINDKMAGFYRSKYFSDGKAKYIAVTQFEESDARRAFPCCDHPGKKATFDIELIIDESQVAISNGPVIEEQPLGGGKKLVRFRRTPKMSTYLLFFGVGEFEFVEDPGNVLIRVAAMPEMTKYARFGLEFGRDALKFCEEYYGIKYPFPKLDLIAIPDFAFGAMENWGAITFRENLLLHYPDITSKSGEENICNVIAHEMAHQWFGNLVTPSDWKYLWLNESFATYFGYSVVSHYYPEWDIWEQFLHGQTDTALDRDALHRTFPIEIPGGEHVIINTSTAPIIYNKGGSVLRQVKGYIGDESFKKGIRYYLKKHEYSCASSHDLWESFDEVSEKPVTSMMKSWIEQPGFPIVKVKRNGDKLVLNQKRFTYLPNESGQEWIIPITARVFYENGDSKAISMLLEGKSGSMELGNNVAAYKINDKQAGFYRVKYDDRNDLHELGSRVASGELPPEDRWGLQNDLYALVRSGEVSLNDYLDFLSNYSNEKAFLPLISITKNLFHAYLVVDRPEKDRLASMGKLILEKVLDDIGYEPGPREKHTTSILRDQILWHAVLYDSRDAREFALGEFSRLMRDEIIHPDIMKSVMQIGAFNGSNEAFVWFDKRLNSSESEHERMNILMALGSFSDRKMIEKGQEYILDKVPNRNKFVPIVSMAANPHAAPYMWGWYTSQIKALEQFHPLHYERVIAAIVPVCGLGNEEQVKTFFMNYITQKDLAKDAIRLSLEKLEINSKMRGKVITV